MPTAPPPRFNALPPADGRDATFGFQIGKPAEVAVAASLGASYVRFQPAWVNVESATTDALTLPKDAAGILQACAAEGLTPMMVAGYGPPYPILTTLTVAADVPIGTKLVPVTEAFVPERLRDFVARGSTQLTALWSYYGSVIRAANANVIELGAPLAVPLAAGDTLTVRRLKYPAMASNDPHDPSVQAFVRYATFLAQSCASACGRGWVCLWNEDAWAHDRWNHASLMFSAPEPGVESVSRLNTILRAAAEVELPDGVSFINGGSDKSGGSSAALLDPPLGGDIYFDGMHDYTEDPEGQCWDQTLPGYPPLEPRQAGNFGWMAQRQLGTQLRIAATEVGTAQWQDKVQARYLLRKVLTHWGCGIALTNIYTLHGATTYAVTNEDWSNRPAADALRRLAASAPEGAPQDGRRPVPVVVGAPDAPWPLVTIGAVGGRGGALYLWQRTHSSDGAWWQMIPAPAPVRVDLWLAPDYAVESVTCLSTGEPSPWIDLGGGCIALTGVADEPVAVVTAPS